MAKMNGLAKAFEEGASDKARSDDRSALKRSMIIISAVEKLKRQGIKVTKKAQMDYMLAQRLVGRASQMEGRDLMAEYRELHGEAESMPSVGASVSAPSTPPSPPTPSPANVPPGSSPSDSMKRNPKDHPREFQEALNFSRRVIAEVETMQKQGVQIPPKKMDEYLLGKKFLEKYNK